MTLALAIFAVAVFSSAGLFLGGALIGFIRLALHLLGMGGGTPLSAAPRPQPQPARPAATAAVQCPHAGRCQVLSAA